MSDSEANRLLERLVADADFRARFEADPAGAAREAGFGRFADDLAATDPAPMQALDVRESRSSLAGAFMAAAAEGFALFEVGGRLFGVDDAQAAVGVARPAAGQTWDPDSYGLNGSGGPPIPEVEALLHNHNVSFETAGLEDLKAGRMDPRVVSVLTEISREHKIVVSCTCSDHAMHTAGGSISNHYYGRAIDLGSVDGKPVNSANAAAREVAQELAKLDPSIRPSEIGSPWALPGAAYFTDGDHQDHLHIGFDDPIDPSWKAPAAAAAPAAVAEGPDEVDGSNEDDADDGGGDEDDDTDDTESDDEGEAAVAATPAAAAPLPVDPDDWEGNLDDEDGGADEVDGSNEDEADEGGGEDDDGGTDDTQSDDGGDSEDDDESDDEDDSEDEDDDEDEEDEDEDEGADEPGEGSNGEDATDDNAGGDSDSEDSSDSGNDDSSDSDNDDSSNSGNDDSSNSDNDDSSNSDNDDSNDSSDNASGDSSSDAGDDVGAPDGYPGDDAPRDEVAAWMAAEAQQRGLPPELPVMASLVESGLRNLDHGDADSVGFFQMRTSIWDQGTYAGYQDRADLQLKWFLDHAEAVKGARVAAGQPVDDPGSYGEWIADVERPAAQYRGRYQLRLDEARALLDGASPDTDPGVVSGGNDAQILNAVDPDDPSS